MFAPPLYSMGGVVFGLLALFAGCDEIARSPAGEPAFKSCATTRAKSTGNSHWG